MNLITFITMQITLNSHLDIVKVKVISTCTINTSYIYILGPSRLYKMHIKVQVCDDLISNRMGRPQLWAGWERDCREGLDQYNEVAGTE